jgi:hypothetical protein
MIGTAWKSGRDGGTFGIRVGRVDADKFFQHDSPNVVLDLGDKIVEIKLTDSFRRKCSELRGSALKDFFFDRGIVPWPKGKPPKIEIIPCGGNRFSVSLRK